MSTTTTKDGTTVVTVNPRMWAIYDAHVNQGMSLKDANASLTDKGLDPYSGGGGSAAVDKVRKAVEAGARIDIDGVGEAVAGGTPVKDRYEVAEGIMEGASVFLIAIDRLDGEVESTRTKATRLREEADRIDTSATALAERVEKSRDMLTSLGFDFEAFDAALVAEVAAPDDAKADDAKAKPAKA